jgi:tetratricopeptide (TPR) repeat protein
LGLVACGGGVTPIQTAYNKGVYLASSGEYAAAIAEYRDAVREDPSDLRSRFNLAATLEMEAERQHRLSRNSQTDVEALLSVRHRDEARTIYQEILAEEPLHERATQNLAAMEWESGASAESEARLRALLAARPDLIGPRLTLAARAQADGRLEVAEEQIKAALAIDSTHPDAQAMYGDLCVARGDLESARNAYLQALVRRPEDLHALVALGRIDHESNRPESAEAWLRRALFVFPRHASAHALMADISEKEDRLEEAVKHLWELRSLALASEYDGDPVALDQRLRRLYRKLQDR